MTESQISAAMLQINHQKFQNSLFFQSRKQQNQKSYVTFKWCCTTVRITQL